MDVKVCTWVTEAVGARHLETGLFCQVDGAYNLIVFELFAKSAWHLSSNVRGKNDFSLAMLAGAAPLVNDIADDERAWYQ